MNEKHRILLRTSQMPGSKHRKRALHRTYSSDASLRLEVHTDVSLDKLRCSVLQSVNTCVRRIDGCTAFVERLLLSVDTDLRRLKAWHTHLKVNEWLAGLLLKDLAEHGNISDCSSAEISKAHGLDFGSDYIVINRSIHVIFDRNCSIRSLLVRKKLRKRHKDKHYYNIENYFARNFSTFRYFLYLCIDKT